MILISPWVMLLAVAVRTFPKHSPVMTDLIGQKSAMPMDSDLICEAEELFQEEKLLAASRLLRRVRNPDEHLKPAHLQIIDVARVVEKSVDELLASPDGEWKKQGESHGEYDTIIYYKVESGGKLTCRIETPIPQDMLVPILSVWNESSLYETWIPSWKKPVRLGVRESKQILNDRRGHQVIQINCDVPWPLSSREVLMDVTAVDDIDETGCIIAKMQTLGEGKSSEHMIPPGFQLPRVKKGSERVDFDGSILFRACPTDHPNYAAARRKFSSEPILLQYTMCFDAKMAAVPHSFINFVTRVVIGMIWSMMLNVAEEVKNNVRKDHVDIIREKAVFYKWLEDRCHLLVKNKKKHAEKPTSSTSSFNENNAWTLKDALRLAV